MSELEGRVKQLELNVALLERLVGDMVEEFANHKGVKSLPIQPQIIPQQINDDEEFTLLTGYLQDTNWPNAVEPALICNQESEEEKFDRAEGILDMVVTKTVKNVKFLDFGCGQGHVVEKASAQECKLAVGYDIESQNWQNRKTGLLLTTDWEEVKKHGPYDIVLVYDVIDHIVSPTYEIVDCHNPPNEIVEVFKKIKSITAQAGSIYVRCHPWVSKHGSHLYSKLNKAFLQLIFTDKELLQLGIVNTSLSVQKIIHPLNTYSKIFNLAGFKNVRENARLTDPVEPFFERNPLIAKRIKQNWLTSADSELRNGNKFPIFQMEMQFIDFQITN